MMQEDVISEIQNVTIPDLASIVASYYSPNFYFVRKECLRYFYLRNGYIDDKDLELTIRTPGTYHIYLNLFYANILYSDDSYTQIEIVDENNNVLTAMNILDPHTRGCCGYYPEPGVTNYQLDRILYVKSKTKIKVRYTRTKSDDKTRIHKIPISNTSLAAIKI